MNDYEIPAIGLSEAATDNIKNIVTRTAGECSSPSLYWPILNGSMNLSLLPVTGTIEVKLNIFWRTEIF